jgi:hypothetical protein
VDKGIPFKMVDGSEVVLDKSKMLSLDRDNTSDQLQNFKVSTSIILPVEGGGTVRLSQLAKTDDMGGKPTSGAKGIRPEHYEESISVEFNRLKGFSDEDALKQAFQEDNKSIKEYVEKSTANPNLVEVGKSVAKDLLPYLGGTEFLVHSGKGIYGVKLKSSYPRGTNKTPKSDVYGMPMTVLNNRMSLKMASDNSGAQLMSGKGGDSEGVILGAYKHFVANEDISSKKQKDLVKLSEKVGNLIEKNFINSFGVGATKDDFEKWWKKKELDGAMLYAKGLEQPDLYAKNKKTKKFEKVENINLEKHVVAFFRMTRAITGRTNDQYDVVYIDSKGTQLWDVFPNGYVEETIERYVESQNLASGIKEILDSAIYGKTFEDDLKSVLEDNTDFHKWVVYEAASGHYKFSGESASEIPIGNNPAIAHSFLVFDKTGFKNFQNVWDWSLSHTDILSDCNLVFKSSGRSKYLALRMRAVSTNESIERIITEEYNRVFDEQLLNEFRSIKKFIKQGIDIFKTIGRKVMDFLKSVVSRVKKLIIEIGNEGIESLYNFFGIEISGGSFQMKNISW